MPHKLNFYFFLILCTVILSVSCDREDDDMSFVADPIDTTGVMDTMGVTMDTIGMTMDTMGMDSTGMVLDTTGMDSTSSITYLALGDSYTIGQGINQNMNFPNQLSDSLGAYTADSISVDIIAQTGWTTRNLLDAISQENPAPHDVVSLLIGVNNQFQNQSYFVFQDEFNELLDISIYLAGDTSAVFVVSIPDYGVTPFGSSNSQNIAEALDNYNAYMKGQCDELQIPFIDITSISRELGDSDGALAPDNLHPSAAQYALWVEKMVPIVLPIFEGQ
jgi:lysophospholipase L1-like esterase